jgi:hypothetical protein
VTFVRPLDWKDGMTIVCVWSLTNVGLPGGPELARFLLIENANLIFGGFAFEPGRQAVAFGHTLLGSYLQRKELGVAIGAVARTADEYDDLIKARFGGRLFTEA